MKAVVMAGGEGSRLRPLTSLHPKPLVPILGRPIMEHIILLLKEHGITEIVVTLHYLADTIEGYFGDGRDLGVKIVYSIEDIPQGTAGSVKKAEKHLRDETFLIISGDALTDLDIPKALRFHRENGSLATMILAHVPNPLEFGVVITDEDGRIHRFLEKPSWGEVFSDTVNTGMYILEPDVFNYMQPEKSYDWSQDIFPQLLRENKPLFGYITKGYWCDVGNLTQYREAQYQILNGQTQTGLRHKSTRPGIWVGDGCQIDPSALINPPVFIGDHVTICENAVIGPYTVLGDHDEIGSDAKIERSILWEDVYVGYNSDLNACTVCKKVVVGRDCTIHEGAVIGDNCSIHSGSTVRSGIKLWPDKIIEAGSTVTMSLVWGRQWSGSLFRNMEVAGLANVEITPEFATKLGASFGAHLKRGASVITARDSSRVSRMIKRAIISGLLSVGCEVFDMRSMPAPIVRQTVRGEKAAGGVYVRTSPSDPREMMIELLDSNGINLSKAAERKVEAIFFREDYHRVPPEQVGSIEFAGRSIEQYHEALYRHINTDVFSKQALKVVADFAFSRVGLVYTSVLGHLSCDLISLNAYPEPAKRPRNADERQERLQTLSRMVTALHADIGVVFEHDGERLTLVDRDGYEIKGNDLLATFVTLVTSSIPSALIAVPVNVPSAIDELVQKNGGRVLRAPLSDQALMLSAARSKERVYFAGDDDGGFIFSEFQPAFDGMFAFAKFLEMSIAQGVDLAAQRKKLPTAHLARMQVSCPWETKGKVMRELNRRIGSYERVETIDGIKFYLDGKSWVLIVPDAWDAVFHVFAESSSNEEANELVQQYAQMVQHLQA